MIKRKIMCGLENIHVAKFNGGGYSTPILIEGAKSVEAEFEFETEIAKKGKDSIRFTNFIGGTGTLEVLGLTSEEYGLLFGSIVNGKKVTVKDSDISPKMALMFSRKNSNGENIGYCIYKVVFRPIGISANTLENGAMSEETISIEFDIESRNGDIYYFDDCDDSFFYKVN